MSEGEKVAEVSWCQQPHLIRCELDFHADFGREALGSVQIEYQEKIKDKGF